uniref:Candidate secreted effector n=1 Tax=Meloidogyne incognita TaxID=6306 RepID=A0A914LS32_MELIC
MILFFSPAFAYNPCVAYNLKINLRIFTILKISFTLFLRKSGLKWNSTLAVTSNFPGSPMFMLKAVGCAKGVPKIIMRFFGTKK